MVVVAVAVVLASAGIAAWRLAPAPQADPPPEKPPRTAPVISGPLTSLVKTPGVIGFADQRDIGAALGGVLTALPAPGTVIGPGQELYRVADRPVILMRGGLPVWRDFAPGMDDGPDVRQLEQNLADLGFFTGTIDDEYTDLTERAIRAWQKSLGLDRDGVIPRGRIVFSPADIRVGEAKAAIGAEVGTGTPLYAASSAVPVITAQVPSAQREGVAVGVEVRIALPDGTAGTGRITAVGAPQEKPDATGKKQLVIPITVTPDDPAVVAPLVPLTAQLTISRTAPGDVLQVPVDALLAIGDERFAVEVRRDGRTVQVPVRTGRFSSGMVEITEGDLTAGDDVVVPG